MNTVTGILRRATSKGPPYNIICSPTHERAESALAQTGHNFYAFIINKTWETQYAPLPTNYHIRKLQNNALVLPADIEVDIVLSQSKFAQYRMMKQISDTWRVPLITIEHTLPLKNIWSSAEFNTLKNMRGDIDVFVSENQQNEWGRTQADSYVNNTGIDTKLFNNWGIERGNHVLCVGNKMPQRDFESGYSIIKTIMEYDTNIHYLIVGDNPGVSKPAQNMQHMISIYNEAAVFLNTSCTTFPTTILEALACGTPVVSVAKGDTPKFIKHGINGFLSNKPEELLKYCKLLLNDKELAKNIGAAGRQTAIEKFNINRFVNTWNEIFRKAIDAYSIKR